MRIAVTAQAPRLFRSVERLRGALLWLTGFAGAIVFMEPSPYEVASLLTMFVFVCSGLTLRPAHAFARTPDLRRMNLRCEQVRVRRRGHQ